MAPGSGFGFVFGVSATAGLRIGDKIRERHQGSRGILVIVEVAAFRIWPEWTVVEVGAVLAFVTAIESCR